MDFLKQAWASLDKLAGDPTPQARKANLERLAWLSVLLDARFSVPFKLPIIGSFKFGVMPLLDLIPYGGATFGALISGYMLYLALKFNIPKFAMFRLFMLPGLSLGLSWVPFFGIFLGSGFDLLFKPSVSNLRVLSDYLKKEDVEQLQKAEVTHAGEMVGTMTRSAPPPPPR